MFTIHGLTVQPPKCPSTQRIFLDVKIQPHVSATQDSHHLAVLIPWCRVLLEKLTVPQLVKKFHSILWNPKVHYRIQKYPPPAPIMSQLDPVHTNTSHFLEILLNVVLPSTPGSYKWSLSLRFPHQNPTYTFPLPHTCYMPRLPHSSRCYYPNNIG